MHQNFENSFAGAIFRFFGGPARGSALERASPPAGRGKFFRRVSFVKTLDKVAAKAMCVFYFATKRVASKDINFQAYSGDAHNENSVNKCDGKRKLDIILIFFAIV